MTVVKKYTSQKQSSISSLASFDFKSVRSQVQVLCSRTNKKYFAEKSINWVYPLYAKWEKTSKTKTRIQAKKISRRDVHHEFLLQRWSVAVRFSTESDRFVNKRDKNLNWLKEIITEIRNYQNMLKSDQR